MGFWRCKVEILWGSRRVDMGIRARLVAVSSWMGASSPARPRESWPSTPKGLTVAAGFWARRALGSPMALTVVLVSSPHILPIRRLSVH